MDKKGQIFSYIEMVLTGRTVFCEIRGKIMPHNMAVYVYRICIQGKGREKMKLEIGV